MPKSSAKSPATSAERQDRLAEALRANLKRRKAKARVEAAIGAEPAPDGGETGADAEGATPPRPNMAQKNG